jgi:glutathione S-transferase
MSQPEITLHALPPSHPCMTVAAALKHKELEFERVDLRPGTHNEEMEKIYGEGRRTVPGIVIDGQPLHGSVAILERLEEIRPEPTLYPGDGVREAERWGDAELQDLGRRLPWGALHFRPEAMGTFGGGDPLDPAGTDYAMRYLHASWKYHRISCERLAEDLAGFPEKIAHIEDLGRDRIVGGDAPTAADLQIGATIRVILTVGDAKPLLADTVAAEIALRWFPDYPGEVPAGAFPSSWLPT